MVLVKTFFAYNDLRNYSYLIFDKTTGNSWVIDPYESNTIIDYIRKNGLVLKGILNTHQHSDHTRGNFLLCKTFQCPVQHLGSEESIQLDPAYSIKALNTPGHTLDHQAFLFSKMEKPIALFSGDTLFNSGVGNCMGGGDVDLLFNSIRTLMALPAQTILYPGHDYRKRNLEFALTIEPENKKIIEKISEIARESTELLPPVTLKDELMVNPFLRLDSLEIRQNLMKKIDSLHGEEENSREFFKYLRKLRDQW